MTLRIYGAAIAAVAVALPGAAVAQRAPQAQIVIVDTQRILSECVACKAAATVLQAELQQIQGRAQQLGQPLEVEAKALADLTKGKTTYDAATTTRINTFQSRQTAAQRELQQREQTFQRNRAFVSQQINTRMEPIIVQVMTARGANIALDKQATLATASALDVTTDVLRTLDQQLPSVSAVAPPPAAAPAGTAPAPTPPPAQPGR